MIVLVAPFTGAWIETQVLRRAWPYSWSLPSRERGLKQDSADVNKILKCRSLHGSVD